MQQDDIYYEDEDDGLLDDDSFVRPFIITGGRGASDLAVEVMVMSTAIPRTGLPAGEEYAAIHALCAEPQSIAEVSARCKLPLGVARVLVSDLVAAKAMTVAAHEKLTMDDELAFLDRIIEAVEHI